MAQSRHNIGAVGCAHRCCLRQLPVHAAVRRLRRWLLRNSSHYEYVVRFGAEHQEAPLADWLRGERFAERPVRRFGPTPEEAVAFEQSAFAWGFRTGALRRVIQAFRREPGSLTRQWSAAHQMLARYQMLKGRDVAAVFISWA